jgi:hypothetical protein
MSPSFGFGVEGVRERDGCKKRRAELSRYAAVRRTRASWLPKGQTRLKAANCGSTVGGQAADSPKLARSTWRAKRGTCLLSTWMDII